MLKREKLLHLVFVWRSKDLLGLFNVIVMGMIVMGMSADVVRRLHPPGSIVMAAQRVVAPEPAPAQNEGMVTSPQLAFSSPPDGSIKVSSLFDRYYHDHHGALSLGAPVTSAFPLYEGWMQFFESGALFEPVPHPVYPQPSPEARDPLTLLLKSGIQDAETGVVRLYPLSTLLMFGSLVPIGDERSTLTYVDVRKATSMHFMLAPSAIEKTNASLSSEQQRFFARETPTEGSVGHGISQTVWNAIHDPTISPDGWQQDFGSPLTDEFSLSIRINGQPHHMLAQAFERDGLVIDLDTLSARGSPIVRRFSTGRDYVRTFGLPAVTISPQQSIWTQDETSLLTTPGTDDSIAHVGPHFQLQLVGDTEWRTGVLWYHVEWFPFKESNKGWVSASSLTFTSPGAELIQSGFDALSPALAVSLANAGLDLGVMVYDLTYQRVYASNSTTPFVVASSMKVPIMLTFFDLLEQQGRAPDEQEMQLLEEMIEHSNNDAASELYYNRVGGADGVMEYLRKIGVDGLSANQDAWGYSLITPQTMVQLLARLQMGSLLTPQDRTTALFLMNHIEPEQQVGVGSTAPKGASVAMKDGWVVGPDGWWVMNSSGIVTLGKHTYIIAVYTQESPTLEGAQATVARICAEIAQLLLS